MNCLHCGKPLGEGAKFCSFCGTPIGVGGQRVQAEKNVSVEIKRSPEKTGGRSKKKTLLIVAIAAVLCVLAFGAVGIFMRSEPEPPLTTAIEAYISESGDAYICYSAGQYLKINEGNIQSAYLSPDREHIVYLTRDGELKYCDFEQRTVILIQSAMELAVAGVTDSFVLYSVNGESLSAYNYAESSYVTVVPEDASQYVISDENTQYGAVAYVTNNEIRVSSLDRQINMYIAGYEKNVDVILMGVAPNGEAVLWAVADSGKWDYYLYSYGSIDKFDTTDKTEAERRYILNAPADSSELVVVAATDAYNVYIKEKDKELVQISMNNALYSGYMISSRGYTFSTELYNGDQCFYMAVSNGEEGFTLCYADVSGSYREVIKGLMGVAFVGDSGIVCLSTDYTLYYSEMDVAEGILLDDMIKISDSVSDFKASRSGGDYIYYTNKDGRLYSYCIPEDDSESISSDVEDYYISTDSESVFYTKGGLNSDAGHTSLIITKLYAYDSVTDNGGLLSSQVIAGSITSNLANDEIDKGAMWFEELNGDGIDGSGYKYNAKVYIDGEVREIIKNING